MNLDHTDYVADCYSIEKYMQAYPCGLEPSNGSNMWSDALGDPVQPPKARKMPGMPPKKRKRDADEKNPQNPNKLKRIGLIRMICQRCQQPGHNTRTCRNEAVKKTPIEKVQKSYGAMTSEETGNIYARMPSEKRAYFVNPTTWKSNN
ncbi:hypothetical protein C2S53_006100 [Perilla frutescens var. hirtella]|uniref:CCHC-type domain-containing protein n=1 Tax=Perilla frutescens var. hirtella TaxID=608512 RepID=A0AAD4JKX3_PERFH|nr:hypothetical protein C2S53_006100 [Perilla frutescens var. hirtella]